MSIGLSRVIQFEEGYSNVPYLCSAGYVTIGYGTKLHRLKNLDPTLFCLKVERVAANAMLYSVIEEKIKELIKSHVGSTYQEVAESYPNRDVIISSMAYQLGTAGLLGFHDFWAALEVRDFIAAGAAMLDSKWARVDSPNRAKRHAEVMTSGILSATYPRKHPYELFYG
jgi:lysozyme